VHLDNLRCMPNRQARVRAAETATFGGDNGLVANQQHFHITFLSGLVSPFNGWSRPMVTTHDVERDLHSSYVLIA
jgi:hypothetical protein